MNIINNSGPCILAIETSCDDTSIAILKEGKMLANITANQAIHEKYGGVVPELASRDHEKNIVKVYYESLRTAGIQRDEIDYVAFTQGPGLLGSLLVGTSFAKSLSLGLNKPLIAVNHLEAHVASLYIDIPQPKFPFLTLLVSGGHTELVLVEDFFKFTTLGGTLDDAAGEAFDKIGKMLNLGYPAGPLIDQLAENGISDKFQFTYSKVPKYKYSFSGLKTQVLYFLQKKIQEDPGFIKKNLEDLCASIQHHIVSYLLKTVELAAKDHELSNFGLVGGVSANNSLRKAMNLLAQRFGGECYIPKLEYCTDNAAMIAKVAEFKAKQNKFDDLSVKAKARF